MYIHKTALSGTVRLLLCPNNTEALWELRPNLMIFVKDFNSVSLI